VSKSAFFCIRRAAIAFAVLVIALESEIAELICVVTAPWSESIAFASATGAIKSDYNAFASKALDFYCELIAVLTPGSVVLERIPT
jgi:hypothetical protein